MILEYIIGIFYKLLFTFKYILRNKNGIIMLPDFFLIFMVSFFVEKWKIYEMEIPKTFWVFDDICHMHITNISI